MSDGKTIEMNCAFCNRLFLAPLRKVKTGERKFCSLSCFHKGRVGTRKVHIPNTVCSLCGTDFYARASRAKHSRSGLLFCSRRCKEKAQISRMKGVTPAHYYLGSGRYTYRLRALRELPQTCTDCGWNKVPAVLVVHHLDRDRTNNDISNLVVLCPTCHQVRHYMIRQELTSSS